MAKKEITFADKANSIHGKYYKTRKPGEDSMTDDAYNREMSALMQAQEAMKQQLGAVDQQPESQEYACGGKLPKLKLGGDIDEEMMNSNYGRNDDQMTNYMNPISTQFQIPTVENVRVQSGLNKMAPIGNIGSDQTPQMTLTEMDYDPITASSPVESFSPGANLGGLGLSLAGNLAASLISARGAKDQRSRLDQLNARPHVDLKGIDLSRERANIKSNQALSEAAARQNARSFGNSSAAMQVANLGRIQSQRVAGNQLAKSFTREEESAVNAANREAEINQRIDAQASAQAYQTESQFGNVGPRIWSDLAQSTVGSVQNYMAEDKRIKEDYNYLNMVSDNYGMSYDEAYRALPPTKRKLADMGIITPDMKKILTKFGQNKLNNRA